MRARSLALSALGLFVGVLVWWLLAQALPPMDPHAGSADRLATGAAALLPAAVVLAGMFLVQMAIRFATGAFDPTSGGDGRRLLVNQRVIANTVEQMACLVPAVLALSAAAPPGTMPMVQAAALTFAAARLVFWAGYHAAPLLRAPGMAASAAVNLALLAAAVWAWLP